MVHFCDLIKFMLGMRHGEILLLNTVDDIIISIRTLRQILLKKNLKKHGQKEE